MYSAYLDRFTDNNKALIIIKDLQQEFHVDTSILPPESIAGTWFAVDILNNEIVSFKIDQEKTIAMTQEIEDRIQRLKSKTKSRFKRR